MFASTIAGPVAYPPGAYLKPASLQPAARDAAADAEAAARPDAPADAARHDATTSRQRVAPAEATANANGETLTEEDLRQLEQLKATDRDVRQHEMAHQIAGGQYAGAASYEYEIGPDGQRYAVAGTVPIDYGPVSGDPSATIDKMQQVISAALAPADPSPKDHQVAATARQYLLTAQLELAQQQSEMDQARDAARSAQAAAPDAERSAALSERSALEA